MKRFTFNCGDIRNLIVEAESSDEVFNKALIQFEDVNLSILYSIKEEGASDAEVFFGMTGSALEKFELYKEDIILSQGIFDYDE